MIGFGANYSIRDEIREFWSERAATFDQSVGHEIFSEAERRGWHQLIRKHLGDGAGRKALDLASGTGVISHLLHDMGFAVTGADWSEAMLAQARAKSLQRGSNIRFIMRDAENTQEPRASYDVITNRHLVWTLVDAPAAFEEWFELLKPGGKLLIVDGNMGRKSWVTQLRLRFGGKPGHGNLAPGMAERLQRIREQVHFSGEMPAETVVAELLKVGFVDPVIDRQLIAIHWPQARKMPFWRALERLTQDRFAICVTRPQ
ncbi:MAG: methyltransferase UbiE/COQ5 family protein [Devosia sp.]|jgi:ubiquinone/menaquinone biosynthesis C-methylase UbiE|nr:methyltransferase UbiE/COQ5 family protein [Devosia sp.]